MIGDFEWAIDKAIAWLGGTTPPMRRWESILIRAITGVPFAVLWWWLGHIGWP